MRRVSWTLSECAVLLEDAVGVYATTAPDRDAALVRSVIVAVAGLKAVAASEDDEGSGPADALWLARSLALEAAGTCHDAAPAAQLERCEALCRRAAAACEAGIRLEEEAGSSFRPMEARSRFRSLVLVKRRLLFLALALGLLVLAVGGWLVQGLRCSPRALLAAAVR